MAGIVVFFGSNFAERDEEGKVEEAGDLAADDLRVGDCLSFADRGDGEVFEFEEVAAVPCDQPHSEEVFAVIPIEDEEYPGDEALELRSELLCAAPFEAYVGRRVEESALAYIGSWPTESGWRQNLRTVACVLYRRDGAPMTQSAQGTGW